jgi:integrase
MSALPNACLMAIDSGAAHCQHGTCWVSMTEITKEYRFVRHYRSRHGAPIWELRPPVGCGGLKNIRLRGKPGSREFDQAYDEAMERVAAARGNGAGEKRARPGSIAKLIGDYYASGPFLVTDEKTKISYKSTFDPLRQKFGNILVSGIDRRSIEKLMADKVATPTSANLLLRHINMLMKIAIIEGYRPDNPALGIKPYEYDKSGHHTWTEEEIAAFEKYHALGSKARLALALMLFTGCRREDVVRFGPGNLHKNNNGRLCLTYVQAKNEHRKPVTVTIPVADELRQAIEATRSPGIVVQLREPKTFLLNENGASWPADGHSFGNWFLRQIRSALGDKTECSPHGLRKAICRRLVRLGMNVHQIMAITGHKNLKQLQKYCEEFEREVAAEQAIDALNGMRAPAIV